jgi:hypothetical protein
MANTDSSKGALQVLQKKLDEKFRKVVIKKTDLDAAERSIRGELIEKW